MYMVYVRIFEFQITFQSFDVFLNEYVVLIQKLRSRNFSIVTKLFLKSQLFCVMIIIKSKKIVTCIFMETILSYNNNFQENLITRLFLSASSFQIYPIEGAVFNREQLHELARFQESLFSSIVVVLTQLLLDGREFCKTFCIDSFVCLQRWFLTTFQNRTPGIRFFVRLSGFLKSVFLKSTHKTKFQGAKIFPDKKCPASVFA